jgi:hypothetical protein
VLKNTIKMKLKNKYEFTRFVRLLLARSSKDRSSGPGIIVSRSLSRGEFVSLSSKHGLFPILERRRRRRALYNKRKERDVQRDDVNKRGVKNRTKKKNVNFFCLGSRVVLCFFACFFVCVKKGSPIVSREREGV